MTFRVSTGSGGIANASAFSATSSIGSSGLALGTVTVTSSVAATTSSWPGLEADVTASAGDVDEVLLGTSMYSISSVSTMTMLPIVSLSSDAARVLPGLVEYISIFFFKRLNFCTHRHPSPS